MVKKSKHAKYRAFKELINGNDSEKIVERLDDWSQRGICLGEDSFTNLSLLDDISFSQTQLESLINSTCMGIYALQEQGNYQDTKEYHALREYFKKRKGF